MQIPRARHVRKSRVVQTPFVKQIMQIVYSTPKNLCTVDNKLGIWSVHFVGIFTLIDYFTLLARLFLAVLLSPFPRSLLSLGFCSVSCFTLPRAVQRLCYDCYTFCNTMPHYLTLPYPTLPYPTSTPSHPLFRMARARETCLYLLPGPRYRWRTCRGERSCGATWSA